MASRAAALMALAFVLVGAVLFFFCALGGLFLAQLQACNPSKHFG